MGDFVQHTEVKSAVRALANPIEDIAAFDALVQSVITENPFGCVSYLSAGITHAPVEKTKGAYTVRIIYQDNEAKVVGNNRAQFDTVAGFNTGATALLADTALATAHRGTAARDFDSETFLATLRCHDPNGELYDLTFTRGKVTLSSYEDDAIRAKVETWADTVPALA